jgi:ribosomal protein L33
MASKKGGKKKSKKGVIVRLQSTASSFFYTKKKNARMEGGPNKNGKLTGLKKYDPIVKKHVEFEEKKVGK